MSKTYARVNLPMAKNAQSNHVEPVFASVALVVMIQSGWLVAWAFQRIWARELACGNGMVHGVFGLDFVGVAFGVLGSASPLGSFTFFAGSVGLVVSFAYFAGVILSSTSPVVFFDRFR
ncbi:hypothetical protein LCGC14_0357600 [marine sediment metagenome]|uniref:Uncharacterized protein n=1 Tax=marine sediment metagenome TaxID=412755 RepID=A0A0F9T8T9_9ZZZZ